MKKLAQYFFLGIHVFLVSCNHESKPQEIHTFSETNFGYYVTDDYYKRSEGYDWIGISVTRKNDTTAIISIRSRSDRKNPTCTFSCEAIVVDSQLLKSNFEGKSILFTFFENQLQISTSSEEDAGLLSFFCSGGGSLQGKYEKLMDTIDTTQLSYIDFETSLSLQGISFTIKSINSGFDNELIVEPANLEIDNRPIKQIINGRVSGAEIEDLNSDGFPEILIYMQTFQGGFYGNVIAYSVNNGKSMSQIYFPNVKDNPGVNKGYYGNDEFTIIETKLGQRFPLFELIDGALVATGKVRQIVYSLKDGENQRFFEIDQVNEF